MTEELHKTEQELALYDGKDKIISSFEMRKKLESEKQQKINVSSCLPTLDRIIEGFEGGELIVVSGRPKNGKTLLCQTLTATFIDQGVSSVWFSFEMPPRQFMRCFPELPLFYLPQSLTDKTTDWIEKRVWEAKIKYGSRVIFIDHLHFLLDLGRLGNPSLEIGAVVRKLKLLALKHNMVIFLVWHITKLERGRIPRAENIRDCLPAGQLVYNVSGKRIAVEKIKKGERVVSKGKSFELQEDKIKEKWKTGEKKIYKLITKTGREIECSSGQRFLATTFSEEKGEFAPNQAKGMQGWTKLKDLRKGQKIAVVMKYPPKKFKKTISENRALLLGWLIGDGHITKKEILK